MDQTDLDNVRIFVLESREKQKERKKEKERSKLKSKSSLDSAGGSPSRARDMEWIKWFEKYVSKLNGNCVFMYQDHHCSAAKVMAMEGSKQLLMSADAECTFSACKASFHAIVYANGQLSIEFRGYIQHSPSEQRARYFRGSDRALIAEKLTNGQSPDQLRLKQLGQLTDDNRKFGNYNAVGCSPHVYQKIRSEAKTALMLDKDLSASLEKIKEQQAKEINVGKTTPGYLQTISISPLRLVFFTEGGLVLWNRVGNKVPVSWDATGGVVINRERRVYYYEMTIANISSRAVTNRDLSGPSFPLTAMLSTSHTTMDLVQWLHDFEAAYHKLYGFKMVFPKPPIIHSDGALVFQMAALRFFNGDSTMSTYLKRCWSIVNKTAKKEDVEKTIVHSCLSHFSKNVKREAIKCYSKLKVSVSCYGFFCLESKPDFYFRFPSLYG